MSETVEIMQNEYIDSVCNDRSSYLKGYSDARADFEPEIENKQKRITDLETGLKKIIASAHDNGSNARDMRKIAKKALEGGGE